MTSRRTPGPAGTVGCVVPQSNRSSYSPSSLLADDPADLILPGSGQTGRRSRKFVTVTAPKAMKAVVDAMFVADAVSSVRMAYQGWKFARMGAKALAKAGARAGKRLPTPKAGQKVYRVYGGDAKPGGASWSPVDPGTVPNYRDAAGLPSGGASGAKNTGRFVIEGTLQDASSVTKTRGALPLDGTSGGMPEYIIPNPIDSGAVLIDRVSGVNPGF